MRSSSASPESLTGKYLSGALSIAQYGLPHAVSRLRDPQLTAHMSPVQVANQIAEPLPVRSRDEFGQVTEAFNAVHLEAVRTAAEQAALRSSVSTMFVNLARRSQIRKSRDCPPCVSFPNP